MAASHVPAMAVEGDAEVTQFRVSQANAQVAVPLKFRKLLFVEQTGAKGSYLLGIQFVGRHGEQFAMHPYDRRDADNQV